MSKILITGSGRCGTLWAASVLSYCGIPCGHQAVFRHRQSLGERIDWRSFVADSSYEAVPILPALRGVEHKIALIREPLAVMRSWRALGLFVDQHDTWERWGLLSRVLDRYFPTILQHDDPMGSAARYWTQWTEAAVRGCDIALKLEDITAQRLLDAIGRPTLYRVGVDDIGRMNRRDTDKWDRGPHQWTDLPADVRDSTAELATRLGYEVPA